MKCVITGNSGVLCGPFEVSFVGVIASLNGKKKWLSSATLQFEAITSNIKKLQNCGRDIEFVDESGVLADIEEFENMPTQIAQVDAVKTDYRPKLPLRDYQTKAVNLSVERKAYGYFCEMGTGKSAILITVIGMLNMANKVRGVLILSPKGVHRQTVEEQFPTHMDGRIRYDAVVWNGTVPKFKSNADLYILSMNVDAIKTKKGYEVAVNFLKDHQGFNMMALDESHLFKTPSAQRTKLAWELGKLATYRRIMTGTPVTKNVADLFSQFKFLDDRILGHKYFISFRNRYCVMGGFESRQIVGHKNIEELYELISRHSFRLTKEEALDLPPKIYIKRKYEPSEVVMQHYNSLKKTFITELSDGSIVNVNNAISCLLRLQQILSGYLPTESEDYEVFSNDRIEQMMEIVNQREGQAVIWARFTKDVTRIAEVLNREYGEESAVMYYGGNVKDRDGSLRAFLAKEARFLVANPAAGATGLNIQSSGCETVIYYNNSFDFVHRYQSEARTHRMGTSVSVFYFDLVAQKTIDSHVLKNLQNKKSVSDLTLDDIRLALTE